MHIACGEVHAAHKRRPDLPQTDLPSVRVPCKDGGRPVFRKAKKHIGMMADQDLRSIGLYSPQGCFKVRFALVAVIHTADAETARKMDIAVVQHLHSNSLKPRNELWDTSAMIVVPYTGKHPIGCRNAMQSIQDHRHFAAVVIHKVAGEDDDFRPQNAECIHRLADPLVPSSASRMKVAEMCHIPAQTCGRQMRYLETLPRNLQHQPVRQQSGFQTHAAHLVLLPLQCTLQGVHSQPEVLAGPQQHRKQQQRMENR